MATLVDHLIKLTDHRGRDLLELTLSKALIDLLPIQRVVIARVMTEAGVSKWLEVASMDASGGGKVVDPLRVDFDALPEVSESRDRLESLQTRRIVQIAWAGEEGPRISYLPLFEESRGTEDGVIEIHSGRALTEANLVVAAQVLHVFRNMYNLLAYSDRDGLTGLLNRKALDDTFYSAVLEEMDEKLPLNPEHNDVPALPGSERRHRVPPNYWLGTIKVDRFTDVLGQHGHLIGEEVLLLVARIVNNTFRTYDRLYRLGGEQFAVLMHCPEEPLAMLAFERFRANMDKFNFPQVGHLTASGSFTRVSAEDSPDTALGRTERAVEFSQQNGGNKMYCYEDLVRTGQLGEQFTLGDVNLF